MKSHIKIALFVMLIIIVSCEKAFFKKEINSTDPYTNFEYLWNECRDKYSYFEYKQIDWDQIYAEYEPKISEDMSQDALFTVLADMLNELKDGHVNLISRFNVSRYPVDLLGSRNFDWRLVREHYISDNYYTTGPFRHDFLNNHDSIAYIRFAQFTGTVSQSQLDFILNRYEHCKGLIFDIRGNGGGVATDLYEILGRFTENNTLLFYSQIKSGPGKEDFSEKRPSYLEPVSEKKYLKKIILLTDRGTYSAGSFMALSAKAINNISIVGDTTGGGLGLPNGGQLPNGWTYRFSISRTLDLQDNNFENGVPPDIHVTLKEDFISTGIDDIIEKAVELLD
jgi:hypothetical protein